MQSRYLLDCTLRDGGYVNDWNFGRGNITCIFNRLCEAGIDYVEVGFLDSRRPYDSERTIQPDTASMCKVLEGTDPKDTKTVAMIDYGTCPIENVQPRDETCIDAIRLIFKKEKASEALDYAELLRDRGYDLFLQMVSITSYSDDDLSGFIGRANKVRPFAVSIVDTYGLLHRDGLLHYFDMLDRDLGPDIAIGYHSHNNFQLGYSNSMSVLERSVSRDIIVDGTLYGMGKSAGNAPLELLAMHMDNVYGKKYDIGSILEAIDNNIMNIYRKRPWGYSYVFYMSAQNDCHPNYVNYLLDRNTLSMRSVNDILSRIPPEKKLNYDEETIRGLYISYQTEGADDSASVSDLRDIIADRKVLLLGPGPSLKGHEETIRRFIDENRPVRIAVNSVIGCEDLVFLTSSKRYSMMYPEMSDISHKVIATSNISPVGAPFGYTVNYGRIRPFGDKVVNDNSLVMLLELLIDLSPETVYLAGFDGFSGDGKDYFDGRMEIREKKDADSFNSDMSKAIRQRGQLMDIVFLTPSLYNDGKEGRV